ncbi:GWxTD domain-containing protein [candidate division KSB1 bacterium]|nr:GWxTD domain-containing protein [candidate division KSB1 bacterium]
MQTEKHSNYGRELFLYTVYNLPDRSDTTASKADFYFTVVNDILTFVKTGDNTYQAEFDLNLVLYKNKNEPIHDKSINRKVTAESYEETNSRQNPQLIKLSVSLAPGKYKYKIELYDHESKKNLTREDDLELVAFTSDRIRISDIIFVDRLDTIKNKITYTPNLSRTFSSAKSAFKAYLEIIPPHGVEQVELNYKILDSKEEKIFTDSFIYNTDQSQISRFIELAPVKNKPGEYYLQVAVTAGNQTVKSQKRFNIHWGNLTLQEDNIDIALEQLSLIAQKKDINMIKTADADEKQKLFEEFWKKRDPTPATPVNELKQEFFRRIDFSNRTFSEIYTGRAGWRTDRGQVYIKNGPPDQVERQPTEIGMPTAEIWYYARLNKRYIFSDRRGSGEFRLVKIE